MINPCNHLGKHVEYTECLTCAGRVRLKVYSCGIFGKCTLARDGGVAVCSGCPAYKGVTDEMGGGSDDGASQSRG